jgi:hypothetical protein
LTDWLGGTKLSLEAAPPKLAKEKHGLGLLAGESEACLLARRFAASQTRTLVAAPKTEA